ncbi:Protein of unknown function [Dyella sp. OK004]|uniref:DUF3348 domain-containing protein n=1 Tax=Dyella sp. OK004 TaxID=1855292 RepID=UPI0008ED02FF|nr:DUF3348 domain-containing protein [Dyella sp. OK004]SFS15179.1 Protein of unknown function [Dyella sp. OK004]
MVQAPLRTTIRGPTFIRLLARLTDVDVPPSRQALSDRLSQWLDWTHAIALSTALDGRPAVPPPGVRTFGSAEEDECTRARASLANTIAGDRLFATAQPQGSEQAPAEEASAAAVDYTVFRQRYIAIQRSMQTATGHLRGRLRDLLAQTSADMARLAEVDAAMELALSPREQTLLAAVPALLGEHFERLRQAELKALTDATVSEDTPPATPGAWLDTFRKDIQSVLLAELDVRFQPVEGLLAALRTRSLGRHV